MAAVRPNEATCAGIGSPRSERRDRLAHRGRGLDAVAALRGRPEEAREIRIGAADEIAVGDERAQAGPDARRPADRERGHALDAVDRDRDVELFGLHVVRRHRIGVRGRAEQHAGIGLEVPVFLDPAVIGQAALAMPAGGAKMKAERRRGSRPIGRAPASMPTASPRRPRRSRPAAPRARGRRRRTRQTPPSRRSAAYGASASSVPPARRMPRRKPW